MSKAGVQIRISAEVDTTQSILQLVARKLGSRTMIEAESLRAYVAGLPRVPTKAA